MKIRISDLMDQVECNPVELQVRNDFSIGRVREKTLQKVREYPETFRFIKRVPRAGIAIAALVLCISTTATAGVIIKWSGFANIEGLSRQEKEILMEEASTVYAKIMVDESDGSVHYLDQYGNETMVLSAVEAAEYEAAQREAKERDVIESTSLIDVAALPLIPSGITEVETAEDGKFADFMLSNGFMILLHPDGGNGYMLAEGDTVTIRMNADDECRLEFRAYRDGSSVGEEVSLTEQHCCQFTAEEDGLYNFSAMYYSVGANMFTDCRITIHSLLR